MRFPDLKAFHACLESDVYKQMVEHAESISTGGLPIVPVCEEESRLFW